MLGWSISASAWRSASNRARTARESMPILISFRATCRLTGCGLLGPVDGAHAPLAEDFEQRVPAGDDGADPCPSGRRPRAARGSPTPAPWSPRDRGSSVSGPRLGRSASPAAIAVGLGASGSNARGGVRQGGRCGFEDAVGVGVRPAAVDPARRSASPPQSRPGRPAAVRVRVRGRRGRGRGRDRIDGHGLTSWVTLQCAFPAGRVSTISEIISPARRPARRSQARAYVQFR